MEGHSLAPLVRPAQGVSPERWPTRASLPLAPGRGSKRDSACECEPTCPDRILDRSSVRIATPAAGKVVTTDRTRASTDREYQKYDRNGEPHRRRTASHHERTNNGHCPRYPASGSNGDDGAVTAAVGVVSRRVVETCDRSEDQSAEANNT